MIWGLADRLVLVPTRHTIPVGHKSRRTLHVGGRQIEIWIERTDGRAPPVILPGVDYTAPAALNAGLHNRFRPCGDLPEPEVFVLKFNGAAGRAERTTIHPLDFWSDLPGEIWSPNPPGFGASEGRASLKWLASTGQAVLDEVLKAAAGRPVIITGNSLGTAIALSACANLNGDSPVAGLILRNPPPLRELIARKFGWRSLFVSHFVAWQVPRDLDSLGNAKRVRLPCIFISSGRDRIVPPLYQELIHRAYSGPSKVVAVPDVDHTFDFVEPHIQSYAAALDWLRTAAGLRAPTHPVRTGSLSDELA